MASQVFMTDMRTGNRENLHDKLERLVALAGLPAVVAKGDLTAIKVHFGERGGHAYIRPTFIRRIVEKIKTAGDCVVAPNETLEIAA